MAAYIQVVLQENVKNLGQSGQVVRVRPGFARNYLVPRQLASYATEKNIARLEHEKREALAKAAKLKAEAEALSQRLTGTTVKLSRPVGAEDRMYGSITSKDIAVALAQSGYSVDKRKIELETPIKHLGIHEIKLRLATDVVATIKVEVVRA